MPTYRDYRANHGPITAFVLSVHPLLWFGTWALAGLALGIILVAGGK